MRKGFIFNGALCVNCKACIAACLLENRPDNEIRTVYIYNKGIQPGLPVINLSLACNHCKNAACLKGCPARAITRHPVTEAVIIDESKCIGCYYCQWNCPYGAPKKDNLGKVAEKCDLCTDLLLEDRMPACVSGCPTGALKYGTICEEPGNTDVLWFPDNELDPSIEISTGASALPLTIIPESIYSTELPAEDQTRRETSSDWSLIGFTFISALSVSLTLADFFKGNTDFNYISLGLLMLAGIISIFHLGYKFRAWRAVINLLRSPLSLEIALFTLYFLALILSMLTPGGFVSLLTIFSGMGLMLAIDAVYSYPAIVGGNKFHSGQAFLSALLMTSFFSGLVYQFLFLAIIKLFLSLSAVFRSGNRHWSFGLRFLRLVLLIVSGWVMFSMRGNIENFIYLLFITGELADRIIFYADFEPVTITKVINDNISGKINEKKRG